LNYPFNIDELSDKESMPSKDSDLDDRHGKGPRALAKIVPDITKTAGKKKSQQFGQLIAHWPSIAGPDIAPHTVPENLVFGRLGKHARLHLLVKGAYALELQHRMPQLINRINDYFGTEVVGRITVTQYSKALEGDLFAPADQELDPEELKSVEAETDQLADDDLRAALTKLGKSVLRSEKNQS
jgi:hypothetical protein